MIKGRRSEAPLACMTDVIVCRFDRDGQQWLAHFESEEIHSALKELGFRISASLVSAVKYRKRKRRAPAVRMAARATRSANETMTVEQLIELKQLADSFGGLEQLRRGPETLAQFS